MPDSPLELGSTEERLRSFLVENFPASQAVLSSAADAPYPLLLLHLQHELAGFALSNGDPRRSFEQSYSFFKQLYADRHREWDELNLTFVLCLAHRDRELEAFCARIETDVYFCRKFAVALDAKWEIELARLPFFPLERRVGGFRRPPSAQTLLKSYGVLAPLAASIVGRVSEESIVEACLSGRVGDPKLVVSDTLDAQIATDDATQTIRLQRVEIENFRAYRRPQSFDFDADVIVLYGPNGFGKTSFFDAVDFAATGDIGRLQVGKHEPRFTKAARHLDAAAESDSVTLSVRAQDGIHEIRRTVEHRNSPSLDGTTVSRKQALLALTGPHVSPGADHVEHLVRLFRATHLFSQEFQTLTENFREHCRLSADDVSRMLAFEDYVTAGRKVGKVLEFIGRSVGAGDLRVAELTDALTKDRAELARFHESARSAESPQAVAALRENLRVKLAAAGVDRSADSDPVAEARGWRAILEARISDMRSVATRLSELSTQAPVITAQRAQLLTQQAERAQTKTQLDETDKQIREVRGTVGKTEAELATLAERERALRHRAQVLAWLREAKPAHDAFAMRHTALNGEIGAFSKALAGQSESLEKLTNQLNATQAQLAQTVQQMEVNRKLIVALTDFAERYLQWQQHIARRRELEQSATQSNTLLAGLQQELQTTTTESNNAALEERRAAAEVARIERMQSDLQNLLGALEAHVTNAHCPACGIRHDSKDDLLRRLREQRNASAVSSDATSKLQEARQRVATLQARVEELKTRRQNAEQTVKAAAAELQNLVVTIDGFETLAREHALDSADTALSARIEERLKSAQSTNNNLVRISGTREQAVQAARTQLATARAQTQTRQQELAAKKQSFDEITTQLNSLRSEAARVQVTLDTDLQELAESENATRRETEEVIAQTTVKRNDLSSAKTSLNERDSRAQNLKQRLDAQDVAIRSLQRVIEKHERDIESLALTRQADQLQIAAKGEEEARRVSLFEELKQSVTGLEMALDVAVTSAASAELTTRIRAADGELGQLRQKQVQDKRWAAYFEQVLDKLVQTQNLAVAGYTGEYGPLTSIIQRRLRAVSGFEGIELQPKDGNIDVRVIRNGEHLRPPDFFSQSQQQILILSLFLTACTTQTWSAFAPILLDDPVTHFDDLNAYSFLDLISGLSETGLRGRQFILSTCDERLFQLARQRFQHLGDRAKVYRFISVGQNGPVIESI